MDHPTDQRDGQTDPLTTAPPTHRRPRYVRGALAATTSAGLLFGAGTAVAGASSTATPGTHHAAHTRAAFRHDHSRNAGKVASVDGTSTTGACGTAGGSGSFVVTTFKGATRTYDVDASTTFVEPGVTGARFNNVCVGDVVAVRAAHRSDQDSDGATGATGATGSSASTGASGDSGGTGNTGAPGTTGVTARKVFIAPTTPPVTPTSVPTVAPVPTTGSTGSTPNLPAQPKPLPDGARGPQPGPSAGAAARRGVVTTKDPSSFDINADGQTQVVDVTAATTYVGPGGPTTYGSVAVGDTVRVSGTDVNGAFTATAVDVFSAPPASAPGPQPGPSPVPPSSGFPARPAPTPVAPSAPGPEGSGDFGHGQGPQAQGFSADGGGAGRDGFGR